MERGLEQGLQQGLQQGTGRALLVLLRDRFGEVDPSFEQRIGAATVAELEGWLHRVTRAERIEDVFGD